jgi:hypothetical protein
VEFQAIRYKLLKRVAVSPMFADYRCQPLALLSTLLHVMSSNRGILRLVTCFGMVGIVVLAMAALVASGLISARAASSPSNRSDLKNFQYVFIIMMENTGYDTPIGNPNAPWIKRPPQPMGSQPTTTA